MDKKTAPLTAHDYAEWATSHLLSAAEELKQQGVPLWCIAQGAQAVIVEYQGKYPKATGGKPCPTK